MRASTQEELSSRLQEVLHASINNWDYEKVRLAVLEGADPNHIDKEGNTALCWSMRKERLKIVKLLLTLKADPNTVDGFGRTALSYAIELNNEEAVAMLLSAGASPEMQNSQGKTALHCSVIYNRPQFLRLFLKNEGPVVDVQDSQGKTALHLAIQNNNPELALLLLTKKSNVNLADLKGKTPLHYTATSGDEDLAIKLLKKRANINAQDALGKTALHTAIESSMLSYIQMLIARKADINIKDNDGQTPVLEAIRLWKEDICVCLIDAKAKIDITNKAGQKAIHEATVWRQDGVIRRLLTAGSQFNDVNFCALSAWSIEGFLEQFGNEYGKEKVFAHIDFVKFLELIAEKPEWFEFHPQKLQDELFKRINDDFVTPRAVAQLCTIQNLREQIFPQLNEMRVISVLQENAALFEHVDAERRKALFVFLIEERQDLLNDKLLEALAKSPQGLTFCLRAIGDLTERQRHIAIGFLKSSLSQENAMDLLNNLVGVDDEVCRMALQINPDRVSILEQLIFKSVHEGKIQSIQFCLDEGLELSLSDSEDNTLFHHAIYANQYQVAKFLVEKRAPIDRLNKERLTPLMLTIRNNSLDIFRLIVQEDIYLNRIDHAGMSPLHHCLVMRREEMAKMLIERNIDCKTADFHGMTPLHYSVSCRLDLNIDRMLIRAGADVNCYNKYGMTAIHDAIESRNFDKVQLLVEHGANLSLANQFGHTALHMAVSKGKKNLASLIMKRMDGVDTLDRDGKTPLVDAIAAQDSPLIDMLVERGAQFDLVKFDTLDAQSLIWFMTHYQRTFTDTKVIAQLSHAKVLELLSLRPTMYLKLKEDRQQDVINSLNEAPLNTVLAMLQLPSINSLVLRTLDPKALCKVLPHCPTNYHKIDADRQNAVLGSYESSRFEKLNAELLDEIVLNPARLSFAARALPHLDAKNAPRAIERIAPKLDQRYALPLIKTLSVQDENLCKKVISFIAQPKQVLSSLVNDAIKDGEFKKMNFFLLAGADADEKDETGRTPVHQAVIYGRDRIFQTLIKKKVSLDRKDAQGKTPLHHAIITGSFEMTQALIAQKADLDIRDSTGKTALHFAMIGQKKELAQLLLEAGADINIVDEQDFNPLYYSLLSQIEETSIALIHRGALMRKAGLNTLPEDKLEAFLKLCQNDQVRKRVSKQIDLDSLEEKLIKKSA